MLTIVISQKKNVKKRQKITYQTFKFILNKHNQKKKINSDFKVIFVLF